MSWSDKYYSLDINNGWLVCSLMAHALEVVVAYDSSGSMVGNIICNSMHPSNLFQSLDMWGVPYIEPTQQGASD
jgi:hypothetical protein